MSRRRAPDIGAAAIDKYREFNRFNPRRVGAFPAGCVIPARMRLVGDAKTVMYRSGKVDPETMRKPKRPLNYIHEHDAGVRAYVAVGGPLDMPDLIIVDVPEWLLGVRELVLLGDCLGFSFDHTGDGEIEVGVEAPMPKLYTIPSGKALVVVERDRVAALIWGGALGVEGRGIVG